MGVAWVFECEHAQTTAELIITGGGAGLLGPFRVDSSSYRPSDAHAQHIGQLAVLHHSYYPESTFSIMIGTFPPKQTPRSTCDRGFDMILSKLSGGLQMDNSGKFEVNGNEYKLKDFRVRIGTATQNGSVKGVIVEVEYTPTWMPRQGLSMLAEFLQMFFAETLKHTPEFFREQRTPHPEPYLPIDTLHQYQNIFMTMRLRA
ncbi:unnamed protein product, partial [Mesorhabditis spiculigera]